MSLHHDPAGTPGLIAMFCLLLLPLLLMMLLPDAALAWGVGVHVDIGSQLLAQPQAFPASVQAILAARPHDFLYGCMSADITIGKKFTHRLQHCHGWHIGRKVLESARSEGERACAYGYLAHLAADSVAHSYFVPYKTIRTFNTAIHNHAYWEMRVDAGLPPQVWSLAHEVARESYRDNDILLRSVLSNTLFSFGTNKRIFNSLILLNRLEQWQKGLQLLGQRSRFTLDPEDQAEYLQLALAAAHSILADGAASPYLQADPTGERALHAAAVIRRNLHHLWIEGKLPVTDIDRQLADFKHCFRDGITHPERLLELVAEA